MTPGRLEISAALHDTIGFDAARELIRVHQQGRPVCRDCGRRITSDMDAAAVGATESDTLTLRFRHATCGRSEIAPGPPPPPATLQRLEWRTCHIGSLAILLVVIPCAPLVRSEPVGDRLLRAYEALGFTRPRASLRAVADTIGSMRPVDSVALAWHASERAYCLVAQRPLLDGPRLPAGSPLETFDGLEDDDLWVALASATPVLVIVGARMSLAHPESVDAALLDGVAVAAKVPTQTAAPGRKR